jgi:hypothetical protein
LLSIEISLIELRCFDLLQVCQRKQQPQIPLPNTIQAEFIHHRDMRSRPVKGDRAQFEKNPCQFAKKSLFFSA